MSNQITITKSEEMYLVTIHKACEHCIDTPIPIPDIAADLEIQPVSANQMVKKLAEADLVTYTPYKGVELTPEGKAIASKILRHRRLWEVFLVKKLNLDLEQADALACQLEHVTSNEVGNRLSEFLDHPTVCFHGDPIPQAGEGDKKIFRGIPLENLKVGQVSPVMRIETDDLTTEFLFDQGIRLGIHLRVLATGKQGDMLVEAQEERIRLSAELVSSIIVSSPSLPKRYQKKELSMSVPLSDLNVGQRGTIIKMNLKGATRQRMLAMGLVKGETILVRRVAPLGDPIDFVIKDYDLSLRKEEAKKIMVLPVEERERA
jgi:DtxR family Mn-dependent transcriptional regulator